MALSDEGGAEGHLEVVAMSWFGSLERTLRRIFGKYVLLEHPDTSPSF